MEKYWTRWGILFAVTILLTAAAARWAYFPGDPIIATVIQSLSGEQHGWAHVITQTVSPPWGYLLLALTTALGWWLAGWRGAVLVVLSFGGLWFAETYLKAMIARPRPSSLLVRVVGASKGYSFPSGFGLIYGATIGGVAFLAWQYLKGSARPLTIVICGVLLLIGGCGRVTLGAHWPSDLIGAYLIAFTWIALLWGGLRHPESPLTSSRE